MTFPLFALPNRRGLYFRSYATGHRLYFSDNEVVSIMPLASGYALHTVSGGVYHIASSIPAETEFEPHTRPSVKGDHFYTRS